MNDFCPSKQDGERLSIGHRVRAALVAHFKGTQFFKKRTKTNKVTKRNTQK